MVYHVYNTWQTQKVEIIILLLLFGLKCCCPHNEKYEDVSIEDHAVWIFSKFCYSCYNYAYHWVFAGYALVSEAGKCSLVKMRATFSSCAESLYSVAEEVKLSSLEQSRAEINCVTGWQTALLPFYVITRPSSSMCLKNPVASACNEVTS